jgi:hypothetical protein
VSSKWTLFLKFPNQNPYMYLSSQPYVLHALHISLFFIWSHE